MTIPQLAPGRAATGKAAKIIAAARAAFLEDGYEASSMDEVARRAGVSKATVYAHYLSKDALFMAVAEGVMERHRALFDGGESFGQTGRLDAPGRGGADHGDRAARVRSNLSEVGLILLERVISRELLAFFRVTLAAAHRFPALGHTYYEAIVRPLRGGLIAFLQREAAAGTLVIADPEAAAEHFACLIRGELQLRALLDPDFKPTKAAVKRQIGAAIDCFLARYGP